MRFTKMHGAGNDFVIINNMNGEFAGTQLPALTQRLCARHTGVGADGLMVVIPAVRDGDYGMLFFNADGSAGEMCGNGARCIARYGYDHGLAGDVQRVETVSGTVQGERLDRAQYRLRLNDPTVIQRDVPVTSDGVQYRCCYMELGNPGLPHAVVFLPGFAQMEQEKLRQLGRQLRFDEHFPRGANVTFADRMGANCFRAVTYERGVEDFTLACGSGSGCVAASMCLWGEADGESAIQVCMPGGELFLSLTKEGETIRDIYLTGPAITVYEGEWIDD